MRFSFGRKHSVSWPKLIGSLVLVGALLMVLKSSSDMFASWDNVHVVNDCFRAAHDSLSSSADCQTQAYYAGFGLVHADQKMLTSRQAWSAVLGPIGWLFFWLAVLVWGWISYKAGWIPRMAFSLLGEVTRGAAPKKRK